MDVDLLSKMVKELILDNDRVVLPGLGAFVAEIVPSTFSDKGYTINPPYRRMYFRAKPDEGTELAELYARGNNVEPAMAARIVGDFISELKSVLHMRKTVVLPGLGRLRATRENNIFFVADEDLDIYPEGFGLEPISLKTHQETKEEVAAAVEDLKSMLMEPETVAEPVPEPLPEPEAIPEPETVPESVSEPFPETEAAEESLNDTVAEEIVSVRRKSNFKKTLFIVSGIIVALAVLLLAALAIVGRTSPEFIDRFLYTEEELRILNQIL